MTYRAILPGWLPIAQDERGADRTDHSRLARRTETLSDL